MEADARSARRRAGSLRLPAQVNLTFYLSFLSCHTGSAGLGLIPEPRMCRGAALCHLSREGAEGRGGKITSRDTEYVSPMETSPSQGLWLP